MSVQKLMGIVLYGVRGQTLLKPPSSAASRSRIRAGVDVERFGESRATALVGIVLHGV
jgi:hypothetical protein